MASFLGRKIQFQMKPASNSRIDGSLFKESCSQGDSTAAAMLFMQHYVFVRAMAVRFAPWPGLVDDVFQQVFLEFMQCRERFDLVSDLRPLLATMTRRIAIRHWKQAMKLQPGSLQQLADHIRQVADEPDEEAKWDDEFEAMRVCLQRLPRKSLELLNLYYFQNVSTESIASGLGMKPGAVRRALSRLRNKLRECVRISLEHQDRHG